ncbi:hypothetical protein DV735_g4326, partial [Chaetothyriales sp. CBS 134920]
MSGHTQAETDNPDDNKYAALSRSDLVARIADLESQLHTTQARLSSLLPAASSPSPSSSPTTKRSKRATPPKPFDPSTSSTRFIALKLAYLGGAYNGFEHANNNVTPKPTVEEVLYKALRKTRLISPPVVGGQGDGESGVDTGVDVVWGKEERLRRYTATTSGEKGRNGNDINVNGHGRDKVRLELNWDGCEYSKCGRTDRGVSAFGQVIALRVRSNRPLAKEPKTEGEGEDEDEDGVASESGKETKDSVSLPYVSLLNSILPPSIRILAWLPDPPADFSARFSCQQRHYKYFFTNPAFCPTPGPLGMTFAPSAGKAGKGPGAPAPVREGWLDIERMREAAKKLVGSHDFRNLCKIDPSNQMSSCVRSISHADIEEWPAPGAAGSNPGAVWTQNQHLNMLGHQPDEDQVGVNVSPKVYTFAVHGSAFLWHQVRCMMGVLFLVGQGLEEPSVIDELLDIDKNPRRPLYEMAEDRGLVLWDCSFGHEIDQHGWVYAGDQASVAALTSKTDSRFGMGGVVEVVWKQWRAAKIDEVLTSSLLGLVLSQGDGSALHRGGFRDPATASRSQKIFDGGDSARIQGKYVAVMNKPKMATLEEQNDKYARSRKGRRRSAASESAEQPPAAAADRGA